MVFSSPGIQHQLPLEPKALNSIFYDIILKFSPYNQSLYFNQNKYPSNDKEIIIVKKDLKWWLSIPLVVAGVVILVVVTGVVEGVIGLGVVVTGIGEVVADSGVVVPWSGVVGSVVMVVGAIVVDPSSGVVGSVVMVVGAIVVDPSVSDMIQST